MRLKLLFIVALSLNFIACDDTIFGAGAVVEYPPGWQGVEALMRDHCVSCHPVLEEPDLLSAIPEDIREGTGVFVVPGDPDNSYLWQLINGSDPGYFMPLGSAEPLPLATVQHVEQWILDGAEIPEGE